MTAHIAHESGELHDPRAQRAGVYERATQHPSLSLPPRLNGSAEDEAEDILAVTLNLKSGAVLT
jgi:hypothetical protein